MIVDYEKPLVKYHDHPSAESFVDVVIDNLSMSDYCMIQSFHHDIPNQPMVQNVSTILLIKFYLISEKINSNEIKLQNHFEFYLNLPRI